MVTVGGGKGMVKRANPRNGGAEDEFNYDAFDDQRRVELWNPATRQWSLGAAQVEYRTYHSTALLLPDGRILSAGDDFNTILRRRHELRHGRDLLAAVPVQGRAAGDRGRDRRRQRQRRAGRAPGAAFGVQTADGDIASASLVSLGATTHANDMNQRYVQLGLQRSAGGVNVTVPPANYVPAGYYMLFLVNSKGVPSVARFVQVDPNAPAPATLPPATTPQPSTPGRPAAAAAARARRPPAARRTPRPRWSGSAAGRAASSRRGSARPARARVIGSGKSGKRALSLAGTSRRAGKVARALPKLATGSYTLRLWVRGRVSVRLSPGGKTLVAASRTSGTWRRVALKVKVTSATRSSLSITVAKGRSARVDDVRARRAEGPAGAPPRAPGPTSRAPTNAPRLALPVSGGPFSSPTPTPALLER